MTKKNSPASFSADMARRIWLAGIGAYGGAFSEAQSSLSKAGAKTSKKFDELVAKGEVIEKTVDTKGRQAVKKITTPPSFPLDASFSLDDRIKKMRDRLGLTPEISSTPETQTTHNDFAQLEQRLENLEIKLDALIERTNLPEKRPRRKTTNKKAPLATSRKATKK